nr:MAG TPA: hypothetical protein [Caudoviricetes sp.]
MNRDKLHKFYNIQMYRSCYLPEYTIITSYRNFLI